jgi:hypothetical protein
MAASAEAAPGGSVGARHPVSIAIVPLGSLREKPAPLPCASCLFGIGEAAGMAGAGACPLKVALLRSARSGRAPHCDAFMPGLADDEEDGAQAGGGIGAGWGLS